ncbi:ATP-binding protein [Streptomyces sp. Ru87]|uniref:ATP-binding protein n=1 Tax=Streptomyces sp. Ru87 TaxID=2044307 RepID=UPI00211D6A10|nr:ATP-binding protein [Streptomyces sp. Ru87]
MSPYAKASLERRVPDRPVPVAGTSCVYTPHSVRNATAPKICRDFVGTVLRCAGQDGDLVDSAVLCASELVGNSCLHADGDSLMLRVLLCPPCVRGGVYDGSAVRPRPPAAMPGPDCTQGRGLGPVEALARSWGTVEGDPLGWYAKGVWFELGLSGAAPAGPAATSSGPSV